MNKSYSHPIQKNQAHADGIFAALFAVLTPALAGLTYFGSRGLFTSPICTTAARSSSHVGGSWLLALLLGALVALGSFLIWRFRSGGHLGGMYNAAGAMVFVALIMHFGGGSGETHFPFFIFTSFLLCYRAWRPIAFACAIILAHHLGFFVLQSLGAPVIVFACLDVPTLAIHLAAALGQCGLLGYIAARMEQNDLELMRSFAAHRLAVGVFENTLEGIVITDDQGRIESVNPAFTRITGYTAEEAIGKNPRMLKSNRHDAAFYNALWHAIETTGQWKGEIWNRRKGGEVFLESQTIQRIRGEDGRERYVSVFNDITDQWHKDKRIEHLAFHDSLTGLANRSLLGDRLRHAIALANRSGATVAVMLVDLDRFKNVNDSFGHEQGDDLLKVVAGRLQQVARGTDTVARLGGDEFVLVLQDIRLPEETATIASRIIAEIGAPIELGGLMLHVGATVGIAVYPGDGADANSLLKSADTAMYDAKALTKGTYRFFNAAMTDRAQARLHLEMDLRKALENKEFELHYQAKMSLQSDTPCGAEVLLRWRHPVRGLVPPMDFIPLAEETGLIGAIGNWVLEEACRQLSVWKVSGEGLPTLAVNVSAVQLRQGTLAAKIGELLDRYQLAGSALEIELTESSVMGNPDHAIQTMHAIRALGVKIAIDDFGTGHSSLAYLKRLPIDALKIDRSFVMDADRSEESAAICTTILGLARNLKLAVVAEGVETAEQLSFLKAQGCTVGQGYYFSRPLPVAGLKNWLRENRSRQCESLAVRD